ncbi:MAG: hypothetical protein V2I74_06295 [Erythrobacter sp.]|nr:hypothetical protein [Erythrobacter sp.]
MGRKGLLGGGLGGLLGRLFRSDKALDSEPPKPGIITLDDPRYERFFNARLQVWSGAGAVDDDVIAYLVSPEFLGAPAWPTSRQAFRVVRPERSLIIASDGLSDPFVDSDSQEPGFGCEVFIECPDLAGAAFEDIRGSWQFDLIETLARNVASFGGIQAPIRQYGIFSMELPAPASMPAHWLTQRGTVGALINVTVPGRPSYCQLDQDVEIRLVALTILLPDETEYVVAGAAWTRAEIAQRLVSSGTGLASPANRRSVLA